MDALECVARAEVGSGVVERLVCHPRLPLVAGLDSARPTVTVWDCAAEALHLLGTIGSEATPYAEDDYGDDRRQRTPAAAWHPRERLLLVTTDGGVARWTPDGLSPLPEAPPAAAYRRLAISPDGGTLWASPSSSGGDDAWNFSDVVDLAAGTVGVGPSWDTGVAEHPAGGLVAMLRSDQGATLVVFAGTGDDGRMRLLRRALILDVDGYETPVFSPDGRLFAVRGNAYVHSLDVFAFPSLQRVLHTTLGDWTSGWSSHNIAFGPRPGTLLVGTPAGTLIEIDVERAEAVEHEVLAGSRITALTSTATGDLAVAGSGGELLLLRGQATRRPDGAAVRQFLDATSDLPEDAEGHDEELFDLFDGARNWGPDDLETVTDAQETDPTWLQLQSAMNNARDRKH